MRSTTQRRWSSGSTMRRQASPRPLPRAAGEPARARLVLQADLEPSRAAASFGPLWLCGCRRCLSHHESMRICGRPGFGEVRRQRDHAPRRLATRALFDGRSRGVELDPRCGCVALRDCSAGVAHVEVRADRTDPTTELLGDPEGWTNEPPTLVAHATDLLSGMQAIAADDGQPRTALRIDDGPAITNPDNEVVHVLTDEGDHVVRFWARDLAGNENDGDPGDQALPPNAQPGTARAKLDMTPPSIAFANAQDPVDPELVQVAVSETLSGIDTGSIEYRPQGGGTWTPLATEVVGGHLEARVDSEAIPDGSYEFRSIATDLAGNEATTTKRANGTDMVLDVPLKACDRTASGPGRRKNNKRTIPYGRRGSSRAGSSTRAAIRLAGSWSRSPRRSISDPRSPSAHVKP